jgi:hypothetical protein
MTTHSEPRGAGPLSTAFRYPGALGVRAAGLASLLNRYPRARQPCHRALQPGGDRLRMGYLLHTIAGALAATQPEAAAMIQGAAEAFVAELPILRPFSLIVTETLGEERARELRARGARMDWDQTVAYTPTQTTQALNELKSQTKP